MDLSRFFRLLREVPVPDDAEPLYDEGTADGAMRMENLERYLALLAAQRPTTILVAEAPGWRGATITGIPFVSVRELTARPGLITGDPAGDGFLQPEAPPAVWEASAAFVWRALAGWPRPLPVAWPVYPHHPFRPGDRLTNRTPRPAEVRAGAPVALELLGALGVLGHDVGDAVGLVKGRTSGLSGGV